MRVISIGLLMIAAVAASPGVAKDSSSPVAKQVQALLDEYEKEGGARTFARQFLALAEKNPKDPAAADALLWVVTNVRGRSDTTKALELLRTNHLDRKKLGPGLRTGCQVSLAGGGKTVAHALRKESPRRSESSRMLRSGDAFGQPGERD